jgi:membrane-associated protease RseP (regulator of RpoE activity)
MIALNVERTLVSKVGRDGWESVADGEREGVSKPAPANVGYQRDLAGVYHMKKVMAAAQPGGALDPASAPPEGADTELDDKTFAEVLREPEFQRFVAAQQTWDRAMAEALAAGQRKFPGATVVGIVGAGHVEGGYGIPHQLKDLGVAEVASFIPAGTDEACKLVGTGYANAMFTLAPTSDAAPERPRLGVLLMDGEGGGARIDQVVPKSVAEATGLKAGDSIVRAAGLEMRNSGDVVDVVGVQAPGTWLPLSVKRDGQEIEMIAKFPPRPRQEP